MPCVLWYTNVIVYKLLFLCFVLCDIPMKWFTNYYFYALRFVIYQWNGSQVVIFMPCVLWYTNGMVYKLLFLCFVFCDIPMEWFASCLFYALPFVIYQWKWFAKYYFYALRFVIYQWNGSQIIIFMLCVLWCIKNDLQMIIFMLFNLWYTNGMVRTLYHNTPSYLIHVYTKNVCMISCS